jgi:hypothetical protein
MLVVSLMLIIWTKLKPKMFFFYFSKIPSKISLLSFLFVLATKTVCVWRQHKVLVSKQNITFYCFDEKKKRKNKKYIFSSLAFYALFERLRFFGILGFCFS